MILPWHHISNDLEYFTQFLQKIWSFYHKVNDFIKICCLAAVLLSQTQQNDDTAVIMQYGSTV